MDQIASTLARTSLHWPLAMSRPVYTAIVSNELQRLEEESERNEVRLARYYKRRMGEERRKGGYFGGFNDRHKRLAIKLIREEVRKEVSDV